MEFRHTPVLCEESIYYLKINPEGIYVDCTLGGGGHARLIAERLNEGMLIGIDQDQAAINAASALLSDFNNQIVIVRNNFANIKNILAEVNINKVEGFLLDLGVSSNQLDNAERGFSYMRNADLDMRMDDRNTLTAFQIVNTYDEKLLTRIFFDYGEERFAKRISKAIIRARSQKPLQTTFELSDLIKSSLPKQSKEGGSHPAKRVFQAIRIEVNSELAVLNNALNDMIDLLNPGGRICVIAYHSLEDRIVKHCFKRWEDPCNCPPKYPCVCNLKPRVEIVSKRPITPKACEIEFNHRARSAKLRVAEKL
jgi:16S rRNA (cytosine1402-N4)-methyltransferase